MSAWTLITPVSECEQYIGSSAAHQALLRGAGCFHFDVHPHAVVAWMNDICCHEADRVSAIVSSGGMKWFACGGQLHLGYTVFRKFYMILSGS
jgi:hypothetical protein